MARRNQFGPIPQICFLREAIFPSRGSILNESIIRASGNRYSVQWKRYSSIQTFFETIIAIRGRPIFKKILFLLVETICVIFSDTELNGSSLLVHLNCMFELICHSGWWIRFLVNCKPFAFIQRSFLLVDTIREIKCRSIFKEEQYCCLLQPFSWFFADISTSWNNFFRLVETKFLSNPLSRPVYTDFTLISNRVLSFRAFASTAGKLYWKEV